MEPKTVVAYLKKMPVFKSFTEERGELELYHAVKVVTERSFASDVWLFEQGHITDGMYYILEGQVHLTKVDRAGVTQFVGEYGPGSVFGEDSLLVGDFNDATAVSLGHVKTLFIKREDFVALYEELPYLRKKLNVAHNVLQRMNLTHFDWVREDEWVIFAVKRHWAQLMRQIVPPIMLMVLLLPIIYALAVSSIALLHIAAIVVALPVLGFTVLISWNYMNWRDDFFVLTTQRVVHIERVWPFKESFEESPLENIEDIYEVRPGFASNLLGYGNLVLQTAGETVQIDMDRVPNSSYLREMIFREIERSLAREMLRSFGAIRETLSRRLSIEDAPPPAPHPSAEFAEKPAILRVLGGWVMDYFFPPAWSVSEDGSTIIWRRFWVAGLFSHLRFILPLIVFTLGGTIFLFSRVNDPNLLWMMLGWLFVETLLFAALIWAIEDWRNDYFQLTPTRMVLVMRKPLLLQESRKETSLGNIQNISFEVPGLLARMLNYGHVMLETAGTMGRFELKWLRYPQKVQSEISRRQRDYMQQQKEADAKQRQQELLNWFATYDTLNRQGDVPLRESAAASAVDE